MLRGYSYCRCDQLLEKGQKIIPSCKLALAVAICWNYLILSCMAHSGKYMEALF